MKKLLAVLMAVIVLTGVLAGCGSDPVLEDFEKFLNTDMIEPNANYEELKSLIAEWETIEDEETLYANLDSLIANVKESKTMVAATSPATEEVTALKDKYEAMLDTYLDAFESFKLGLEEGDEELVNSCQAKLEEAVAKLDEYNAGLEALAKEKGAEIRY